MQVALVSSGLKWAKGDSVLTMMVLGWRHILVGHLYFLSLFFFLFFFSLSNFIGLSFAQSPVVRLRMFHFILIIDAIRFKRLCSICLVLDCNTVFEGLIRWYGVQVISMFCWFFWAGWEFMHIAGDRLLLCIVQYICGSGGRSCLCALDNAPSGMLWGAPWQM